MTKSKKKFDSLKYFRKIKEKMGKQMTLEEQKEFFKKKYEKEKSK